MVTPLARALFGRLFDNAAMYPPAQAPMEASLALHDAAERAPWGFARGRFLCPGARLGDLPHELAVLGLDRKALRVGVVVGSPADVNATSPLDEVVAAASDLRQQAPAVHVELLEYRPGDQDPDALAGEVDTACEAAHAAGADQCFVEVGVAGEDTGTIHERVTAVAEAGRRHAVRVGAKVRCGGLEPGMVPTAAQLATFLVATRNEKLPFKATAGLHHAFGAATGGAVDHHGFVSLLVASLASQHGELDVVQTADLLLAAPDGVRLGEDELTVHTLAGELALAVEDVTAARYAGFVAFGTCSFSEPAAEAAALVSPTA